LATTKALELAQLSALTTVDASGNVTTNTSQIANASGDLTFDSAADIILNVDGGDLRLYDNTVQFGRIANDSTDLVIEAYVADRSLVFKGLDGSTPITALTIDMSASGAATFLDQVTIGGNLIHAGNLTIDAGGDITLNADGADVILADGAVEFGRFKRDNGHLVIKSETIDKSVIIKGTTTSNAVVTALTFDMANSGRATFNENVVIQGNLTVEGTQTTINTTALDVEDKNITLNYHASNDTSGSADGAGITIQDAVDASTDASILWDATNTKFTMSHGLTLLSANHLQFTRGGEIRSDDTGGTVRTLVRVNGSNELEYGWSGSGPVKFMGGGSYAEKIRIHTDGNVGIGGVTAPVTALQVDPGYVTLGGSGGTDNSWINNVEDGNLELVNEGRSTNDGAVRINRKNNPAGDTTYFRDTVIYDGKSNVVLFVDGSEGKVGIGTDTPATPLHIKKAGSTSAVQAFIKIENNAGGGAAAGSSIDFHHYHAGGGPAGGAKAASITAQNMAPWPGGTPSSYSTGLTFGTLHENTFDERVRISSNGNVGIGDTNPSALRLSVVTPTANHVGLQVVNSNTSDSFGMVVKAGNDDNDYTADFRKRDNTNIMRIRGDGNVGINTTSPEAKLHISGNSDVSDEDCMLIIEDVDGSAGSRIPAIVFRSNTGGTVTNQARIRGTDTQGIVMSGSATLGDDLVVQAGGVGIGTTSPAHKLDVVGAIGASQVRHSIRPALNLDFANSKQLDSRITFYRNSIATYYDSNGILRYAIENEPRFDHDPATGESKGLLIEEPRDFLNTNSITIDGGYWGFSNAFVSLKAAVAPDGTYSADGIRANTVNDGHGIFKSFVPVANTYYTQTAYFKRGANRYAQIAWYYNEAAGASNYPTAYFDLDNGTFTHSSGINRGTTMTDVGNGWYRCSVTVLTDSTPSTSYFYATSTASGSAAAYVGTGAIDTYYWGLQIEIGDNPSSFTPSDTYFTSRSSKASYFDENGSLRKAPENAPRYGYKYDGNQWVETGLILEKQAVQRFDVSDAFYWSGYYPQVSKARTTDYFNCGEGFTRIVPSTTSAVHVYDRYETLAAAGQHCFSVFAKQSGYKYLKLEQSFGGNAIFDLDTGTVYGTSTSSVLAGIENYGSGIYRCFVSANITQNTGLIQRVEVLNDSRQSSYAGNGTSGIEIFGMQIEDGQVPTSFIFATPGNNTTTTRSTDVFSSSNYVRQADEVDMIGKNLTSWYNPNGGSFYTEHDSIQGNVNHWLWSLNDERTQYNHIDQLRGRLRVSPDVNNLADINGGVTLVSGTFSKMASRIKKDDFALSMDGNTVVTDTSVDYERNSTLLKIGSRADGAGYLNGTLKTFRYYDKPLSNPELEALTENN